MFQQNDKKFMEQHGKLKISYDEFDKSLAQNILKEEALLETEYVKPLVENSVNKLQRQLDDVNHQVAAKKRELANLKKEMEYVKDQCYCDLKFQKIMLLHDEKYRKKVEEHKVAQRKAAARQ